MLKKLIKLEKTTVNYNVGQPSEFKAMAKVDFEVYEGEYVSIFGPSGCGKSTLLNVVAGLQVPHAGKATVFDLDLAKLDPDELAHFHCDKIGMIFQAYNLVATLSVFDNIVLPQMFLAEPVDERNKKTNELLERFDISEQAKKFPGKLSGGQQQRVAVARALINDPQILLADEPIGNLDSTSAKNVMALLLKLNREGQTIILVTHNPEYLTDCHRVLYMKDGKIVREQINYKLDRSDKPVKKIKGEKEFGRMEATEYDLLVRAFSALSPAQVHQLLVPYKAKVLADYLLSPYAGEVRIDRLEKAISSLFSRQTDFKEFEKTLNRPLEKSGIQFNLQRARRFAQEIERIIRTTSFLSKNQDQMGSKEVCRSMVNFLVKNHSGIDSEAKTKRLEMLVKERLENKIDMMGFQELVDRPFKQGGAGYNRQTAEKFARRLELVLLVKYGLDPF